MPGIGGAAGMSSGPWGKSTECPGVSGSVREFQSGPPGRPLADAETVFLVPRDLQRPLESVRERCRDRRGNHGQPGSGAGIGGHRIQEAECFLLPDAGAPGQEQMDAGTAMLRPVAVPSEFPVPGATISAALLSGPASFCHCLQGEGHQRLLVPGRGTDMAASFHQQESALPSGPHPLHASLRRPLQEEACPAEGCTGMEIRRGSVALSLADNRVSTLSPAGPFLHEGLEAEGGSLQRQEVGGLVLQLNPPTLPPGSILDYLLPLLFEKVQEGRVGLGQGAAAGRAERGGPVLPEEPNALPELPGSLPVRQEPGIRFLPFPHPLQRPGLGVPCRFDPVSP